MNQIDNKHKPMLWNVRYFMDAAISEDFALNLYRDGQLPFFPIAGMEIDCGDGDLREVTQVYWSNEEMTLSIQLKDEEFIETSKLLETRGWKEWE
jgi:SRSO17 transposase